MSETIHVVCPHCGGVNRLPAERLGAGGKCGRCKQALFTGAPVEADARQFSTQLTRSDIPLLVDHFLERFTSGAKRISDGAMEILTS